MLYGTKNLKIGTTLDTFIAVAYFKVPFHKIQRQKSACFTKCSLKTVPAILESNS